ncbi:uncharacterized protein EI90DRAFT_3119845 [Cantharellus anzutake]|uniref:uncharacterized protein n=1 Tax=Cantharellus anzutake TaxID=1750568 RepID=UPI0019058825|nr:uncharacterized protein EI90DRAFT_3119845 [Cantharellus anzutake]KAF8336602.1 hypothetical protein EI90DRAFT_3119845 [Cantharellus anzutake]
MDMTESKKVSVSVALEKDEGFESCVPVKEPVLPSVPSELQWDPEGNFRRALPSLATQREFKYQVDLHAFDDNGLDIPRDGLDMLFTEGMVVIGTVSLHFTRARNTTKGEIRSFQIHWTAVQVVGQIKALSIEPLTVTSSSKKRSADGDQPGPVKKRGPFFMCGSAPSECSSHTISEKSNDDAYASSGIAENLVVEEKMASEKEVVVQVEKGKGKEEDIFMRSIGVFPDATLNDEGVKESALDD